MFRRTRSMAVLGALTVCAALSIVPTQAEEAVAEVSAEVSKGRNYTAQFYKGELNDLYENFSEEMTEQMSIEDLRGFLRMVTNQLGVEKDILEENIREKDGYHIYTRRVTFTKVQIEALVMWAFRDDGTIGGFFIRPNSDGSPESKPAEG